MAGQTTEYDIPYPTSGDSPRGDLQVAATAQKVNDELVAKEPSDHSVHLTGADVRLTASAVTTLLDTTFVLARDSWVLLSAHVRVSNSGSNEGVWSIYIDVDTVFDSDLSAGPDDTEPGAGGGGGTTDEHLGTLTIPSTLRFLTAGSHQFRLRSDRGSNGILDVIATPSLNGRNYNACRLGIIVLPGRP